VQTQRNRMVKRNRASSNNGGALRFNRRRNGLPNINSPLTSTARDMLSLPPNSVLPDITARMLRVMTPLYRSVQTEQIYRVRQIMDLGQMFQTATGDEGYSWNFSLNNLDQSSTFIALFDQCRLDLCVVKLQPIFVVSVFNDTTYPPRLWTAIDYNDSVALTRSQIRQYQSCVETEPCVQVNRVLLPAFSVAAYSGTFTSYSPSRNWQDTASSGIIWYGLKAVLESGAAGQVALQVYDVSVDCIWSFKNVR
jgi:hypothetical protein